MKVISVVLWQKDKMLVRFLIEKHRSTPIGTHSTYKPLVMNYARALLRSALPTEQQFPCLHRN